jgi:hypothetical protein
MSPQPTRSSATAASHAASWISSAADRAQAGRRTPSLGQQQTPGHARTCPENRRCPLRSERSNSPPAENPPVRRLEGGGQAVSSLNVFRPRQSQLIRSRAHAFDVGPNKLKTLGRSNSVDSGSLRPPPPWGPLRNWDPRATASQADRTGLKADACPAAHQTRECFAGDA